MQPSNTINQPTLDQNITPPVEQTSFHIAQVVYLWLAGLFVACLILCNIVGSKFFHFGTVKYYSLEFHLEHSVGILIFPVTFLLTDLLNEYYGPKNARRVTFIGLAAGLLSFLILNFATSVNPAPPDRTFVPEDMFDRVLQSGGILMMASMSAYLIGHMADIAVFQGIKRLTGGKYVWLRATGSTIISQALDSLAIMMILGVFQPLANGSTPDMMFLLGGALIGYLIKFSIAVASTPIIYAGRALMRKAFGLVPLPPVKRV